MLESCGSRLHNERGLWTLSVSALAVILEPDRNLSSHGPNQRRPLSPPPSAATPPRPAAAAAAAAMACHGHGGQGAGLPN